VKVIVSPTHSVREHVMTGATLRYVCHMPPADGTLVTMKLLLVFVIKQTAVLTEVGFTKHNGALNTFIGNLHTKISLNFSHF